MTEQRDRRLESLFDAADEDLVDEAFTAAVVDGVQARRRRVTLGRLTIAALLVMLEILLDSPVQSSLGVVGDILGTSLYPVGHEWLAFVLAPVNTVAGLIGLLLLGLHYLYRKIAC